jgi:HD-GYP domain-containing protein (c-di-GMP phosphodiesterase class II)
MVQGGVPPRAPRPGWGVLLYICLTVVAAAGSSALGWQQAGLPRDVFALIVLAVLGLLSQALRVTVLNRVSLAAGSIVNLAASVLVGPVGAAVVSALPLLLYADTRRLSVRTFNTAMGALLGSLCGLVYLWAGGATDLTTLRGPGEMLMRVGLPLMIADIVQSLANVMLLGGVVWADQRMRYRPFVMQLLTTSGLAQIGYGVIGFLFVILWVPAQVGPFSAVLILLPLFVARWAFVQYGEEESAHERTLAAFVAATEARDPYAAGHSARVAQLAVWTGEVLGFSATETTALRYAAMLHDVGYVSVPLALHGRSRPTSAEWVAITRHPDQGVAILQDIAFLQGSLAGIRHHHERFDGRGYPEGLSGHDIPLMARVIAVADAYDALTTQHPGHTAYEGPVALGLLVARGGTHLDPDVVRALGLALERHDSPPRTPEAAVAGGTTQTSRFDHDHPDASDVLARSDLATPARDRS